jgi:hypothetical protein
MKQFITRKNSKIYTLNNALIYGYEGFYFLKFAVFNYFTKSSLCDKRKSGNIKTTSFI